LPYAFLRQSVTDRSRAGLVAVIGNLPWRRGWRLIQATPHFKEGQACGARARDEERCA
jgi:hypothetical protein